MQLVLDAINETKEIASTGLIKISDWLILKNFPIEHRPTRNKLNIVDLFCGCGGMTLGAYLFAKSHDFELSVSLACDSDQLAQETYLKNFSQITEKFICGDVTEALENKPNDHVHLLLAGPPCQGHSDLNNITRRSDPRNHLYEKAALAVEHLEAHTAIIENVPSVQHDRTGSFAKAVKRLNILGYHVISLRMRAYDFGLPQKRTRHFLIASKNPLNGLESCLEEYKSEPITIHDAIHDLQNIVAPTLYDRASTMTQRNKTRADYLYDNDLYELPNELRPKCHQSEHSYNSVYGRMRWTDQSPTITSGFGCMGQGRFLHPEHRRTITPHEAARLQSFPDFFVFPASVPRARLQTQIGNAVPPYMMAIVLSAMRKIGTIEE